MNENKIISEQEDNVVIPWTPRLITGGKGPPGKDWLSNLKENSVILVKNKKDNAFTLGQFHVIQNLGKAVHLMDNFNPGPEVHFWVDPTLFCQQFELVTILYEPEDGSS